MSALLADNHLALEPLLKSRLAAAFPGAPDALPVPAIGGLVEYLDLLNGADAAVPALFVVYDGDALDSGTGSPFQTLARQSWQVVVALAPAVVNGTADTSLAGAYIARVLRTLSGVRLADGLKPLARVADANPMLYGNGLLFAFLTFSQPVEWR